MASSGLALGRWPVETIRDGADGLVQDRRVLRGGDTLDVDTVDTVDTVGFAALACPWRPGVTTCCR